MVRCSRNGTVEYCLNRLSVEIGARPAGSLAHRAAADFIAGEMRRVGYEVVLQEYPCPDWQAFSGELTVAGKKITSAVNTYSPSCDAEAELVPVSSADDLLCPGIANKIAVVYGEIASSSFLPKNFDRRYYVVENQDRFMELLESSKPGAIIMVNHYDGPRPVLLEDSDFSIPSVTVSRCDGQFVVQNAGTEARIKLVSTRRESSGFNVVGRRPGNNNKRVVICAHYDTKPGTPGAIDNAAGIAALLLLGEYLKQVKIEHNIELVAFGGEDSWFPGDASYIKEYPPDNITAVINIDGIGMKGSKTAIAFFGWPERLVGGVIDAAGGEAVAQQWYASDHAIFWPLGIPTLALTSSNAMDLLGKVIHTENDKPDLVDARIIEQTAHLVRNTILMLNAEIR